MKTAELVDRIELLDRSKGALPYRRLGHVTGAVGLEVIVRGINAAIGDLVSIGTERLPAEVIALRDDDIVVMPIGSLHGVAFGDVVESIRGNVGLDLSTGLVGRVVDGLGMPIDGEGPLVGDVERVPYKASPPNPLERQRITEPLSVGVRAIDTLITSGRGQRLGVFSGSGVGKSSLLGMMARGTNADIVVVALVGERGREVREFLEDDLAARGRENSIVVVATSDEPPLMRLRAAFTATRIAEWFAAKGNDVLLLMDSVTRVATAQREIGLTAGEPPTTRGYPPSVFALLPQLLERAGPQVIGSITGIYTVLVEGDDLNEPITDHVRSILDGHIVLNRELASAGHFPTIDVLESVSRLATKICDPSQLEAAQQLRRLLAAWQNGRDLVEIGAYVAGSNPDLDRYLERKDAILQFLRQDLTEIADPDRSWEALQKVVA